jgi:N-acetylglucosamine kinase-like BadF-type ATPase
MTYEDAKQTCSKAFDEATRRVGANKEAIALEVAVLAARDPNVMRALFIVAEHKSMST